MAPKGTPDAVRVRLHAALQAVLRDPAVTAKLGETERPSQH